MSPPIDQLRNSPDYYLYSIEGDAAIIVPMDQAAYRRSIFLDQRISPAGEGGYRVPLAALSSEPSSSLQLGWIFHVAHCGSTLLARALDELAGGANLVLREPIALRQLSFARDVTKLSVVLGSLARRYPAAGPTLIKANVPVNFILREIAASDPTAPAILLKLELSDYLLAILRSDQHRLWLRNIASQFAAELGLAGNSSDAEAAAALWLGQMRRFEAAMDLMPQARTLDAEQFFGDPAASLLAAAQRLGVTTTAADVAALVAGPLFSTYSKRPDVAFDNAARLERRSQLSHALSGEIALAEEWVAKAAPDADVLREALARRALV